MTLEQTLAELRNMGLVTLDAHNKKSPWMCYLAMPYKLFKSDLQPTPLAAAQQCLERAKNVK